MKRLIVALVLGFVVVPQAFGWGREGHRLVALVAADHLTAEAAENVRILLGRDTMADVASFADDYRGEHPETGPWHYVDIPLSEKTYLRDRDCPAPVADPTAAVRDCVVERVPYFVAMLKDPAATKAQKEFALKMVIHLVGDLHQPMHAIGDARGGNSNKIMAFGTKQCGQYACNLHGLWDVDLIERGRMSEKKYLATLETEITSLDLAAKPVGTVTAWANSSHRAAVQAWVVNGGVVDEQYYKDELPTMNRELELGGLHLAQLLNGVFLTAAPGGEVVKPNTGAPVLVPRGQ